MKKTLAIALLLAATLAMQSQTAIYKRYTQRPHVHAYCMERYPLAEEGDSVCVTLLSTGDSATYNELMNELMTMPSTPRHSSKSLILDNLQPTEKHGYAPRKADPDKKKCLIMRNADPLPGDEGWYYICMPSDRMTILIFLVRDEKQALAVTRHIIYTEF